jgi:hypothetical protein
MEILNRHRLNNALGMKWAAHLLEHENQNVIVMYAILKVCAMSDHDLLQLIERLGIWQELQDAGLIRETE